MSEDSFSIVRLSEASLPKVHTLFAEARNLHFPEGYFLRKYGTNTPELRFVCLLALDNNQDPAGFVAIVPRQLQRDGNSFLGGEFLDVVTHPKHRGKGLFVQLSKQVMDLGQRLGLELLFSTPNHLSAPIMVHKLGWKMHEHLARYEYQHRGVDWYRYATRFSPIRKLYFQKIKQKLRPFLLPDAYLKPPRPQIGSVVWDALFFESKQKESNQFLDFEGFFWWVRFDGGLFVADVQPTGDTVRPETFETALKKLLRCLGIQRAFGFFPKDSFAAQCFAKVANPTQGIDLYILPLTDLGHQGWWEFSLADCDSF
jgi:GNAT superfamily N-acetyltransferase